MIIEKCILTLLAALFTALHATPVFAAEAVAMNVSSEKCGINGTVSVDVMLKSGAPIAAAKLELNYDEQLLDFSDISGDNGCVTEHKANGGAVSVLYCAKHGDTPCIGDVLFTLSFKAIEAGTADIGLKVRDCSDALGRFLDVGELSAGKVTVTEAQNSRAEYSRRAAPKQPEQNTENPEETAEGFENENAADRSYSRDTLSASELNDARGSEATGDGRAAKRDFDTALPLLIGGFSVIILLLLSFYAGQKVSGRKKSSSAKAEDEPITEDEEQIFR